MIYVSTKHSIRIRFERDIKFKSHSSVSVRGTQANSLPSNNLYSDQATMADQKLSATGLYSNQATCEMDLNPKQMLLVHIATKPPVKWTLIHSRCS